MRSFEELSKDFQAAVLHVNDVAGAFMSGDNQPNKRLLSILFDPLIAGPAVTGVSL